LTGTRVETDDQWWREERAAGAGKVSMGDVSMGRVCVVVGFAAWMAAAAAFGPVAAAGQNPPATGASGTPAAGAADAHRAVVNRYCVSCHNQRLKTGGLALDALNLSNAAADAEVWEKVIRKLRTNAMPPAGMPRPDPATYAAITTYLESEIDRAAAARPNPGRTEPIHRLNRAEYRNAVRDLLALEVDVESMLPADDMSYGFDNMAGVLKMTPSLLDRYMAAARHISRLAIGSASIPPTAETFRLRADLSQDVSFDSLPLGTRGGTAIRYHFPLDAEYVIAFDTLAGGNDAHQLEISIDGERVRLFTIGGRRAPMANPQDQYAAPDNALEVRVPVKAGPRVVGVAFVKKTSALVESVREPFDTPHAEGGTRSQPSVASVTISGPFAPTGVSETPSRRAIFACRPADRAAEAGCAKEILTRLARRAYRRPATDAQVQVLFDFYAEGRAKSDFEGGIELALRRLLMSPEFLYRTEADPQTAKTGAVYKLGDFELASRLSFFLWSSIPDDELLNAAERGTLGNSDELARQVRRMLADRRSEALARNFAGQWLYLRTIEGALPNVYLFPNFGENLRQDFRRETELFFDSIVRENRSVLELLTADYTFVNERLARHYGIPNVYGRNFRRVQIPDENRRGLLGQGSILTVTSLADRTTVVGRGKWILENILGAPPPAPPPDVPPLEEKKSGGKVLTLRERMEQHRANAVCASCHARMDPLGFALENFDATGQWRTREGGTPIDASAVLPDGTRFEGPAGLRDMLVRQPEQIATATTDKLLTYALGRGLGHYDLPSVRQIVRQSARDGYRFQSLILGVVNSVPFRMRTTESGN
jgi:mono/diheme cytochrome c family protein